jgi:hypothetical protein
MNYMIVAIAAFLGAMATASLGWLSQDPPEDFKFRKFLGSVIRGLIAAVGIAAAFNFTDVSSSVTMYFVAFFSGAGFDAAGNAAGSAAKKIQQPKQPNAAG